MKHFITVLVFLITLTVFNNACAEPLRIVALGDSLTAGYRLPPSDAFPAKLQAALIAEGIDVKVENAGVSGDTSAGGLARLNNAIAGKVKPDLVLVELGANDMLRSIDPKIMESNLRQILIVLQQQQIPALLIGMTAPIYFPGPYRQAFNEVFPKLSEEFDVPLYAFFLEGIALNPKYNLEDGLHPNAAGIDVIVKSILPSVKKIIAPSKGIMGIFE